MATRRLLLPPLPQPSPFAADAATCCRCRRRHLPPPLATLAASRVGQRAHSVFRLAPRRATFASEMCARAYYCICSRQLPPPLESAQFAFAICSSRPSATVAQKARSMAAAAVDLRCGRRVSERERVADEKNFFWRFFGSSLFERRARRLDDSSAADWSMSARARARELAAVAHRARNASANVIRAAF